MTACCVLGAAGPSPASTLQFVGEQDTFDLAAAGLRGDGSELRISVEVLANKLEQALPGHTRVRRSGGGLLGRGARQVRNLEIELAGNRYELTVGGAGVETSRQHQSGGITIRREPLSPDAWIAALSEDLRQESERSAQARTALEGLLR